MIVSRNDVASAFGVTLQTITNWQKSGFPVQTQKGRANRYNLPECIEWFASRRAAKSEAGGTYEEAKLRLTEAQAEKTELQARKLAEGAIPHDVVVATWSRAFAAIKTEVLALPTRIRALVPDMTAQTWEMVDGTCRRTLDDCAGRVGDGSGVEEPGPTT